jgi:transposase
LEESFPPHGHNIYTHLQVNWEKGSLLKKWIDSAINSGISELRSFAKGLLGDFDVVRNALTMPWSNGQVEGQINKLKMIKRQMYGRASFELLRKRLLLDSS